MSEDERRDDLRRFLRERRARITPEEAGLPPGSRRRVPGLRREEVATIAGIGVSWYTSLENGDAGPNCAAAVYRSSAVPAPTPGSCRIAKIANKSSDTLKRYSFASPRRQVILDGSGIKDATLPVSTSSGTSEDTARVIHGALERTRAFAAIAHG